MQTQDDTPGEVRTETKSSKKLVLRLLVLVAVGLTAFFLYRNYGHLLALDDLAARETELRQFRLDHPVLVYGIAFLLYVAVTGFSLPFATVLTLVFAWYFGFWRAVLLVSFASTAGATVAFLLSRYLLREIIQKRFGDRLEKFHQSLEREGAYYLFSLRLIPVVPFFVINAVMGLTPLKTRTFWWASQAGMLPGTLVYVYAGSQFPTLKTLAEQGTGGILTPQLIAAFVLLGLFPLCAKKIAGTLKRKRAENS
jgi:uncharacterized membrane protein YdjX (TVP38/TMEM64 family)